MPRMRGATSYRLMRAKRCSPGKCFFTSVCSRSCSSAANSTPVGPPPARARVGEGHRGNEYGRYQRRARSGRERGVHDGEREVDGGERTAVKKMQGGRDQHAWRYAMWGGHVPTMQKCRSFRRSSSVIVGWCACSKPAARMHHQHPIHPHTTADGRRAQWPVSETRRATEQTVAEHAERRAPGSEETEEGRLTLEYPRPNSPRIPNILQKVRILLHPGHIEC